MPLHRTYFLYWVSIIEVRPRNGSFRTAWPAGLGLRAHDDAAHSFPTQIAVLIAVLLSYEWAPIALSKQVGSSCSVAGR